VTASAGSTSRAVSLPGRGDTFVRELSGPPGAPTLLLLHGLGATAALNWGPSFGALGRHFRVVAIDHRGHGRGIHVRGHFRLSDCADDAAALVQELGTGPVIPVGYSMGGPISQLFWHRHPELVAGLVLCATTFQFGPRDQQRVVRISSGILNLAGRLAPRNALRRMAQGWIADAIPDPAIRAGVLQELSPTDPVAVAQAGAALARYSARRWIGSIDVPTAVVITERDDLVPPRLQRKLAELIPDASIHPVDGNHRVCAARPELFVPSLVEACSTVARRAASPSDSHSGRS
jgi:pimeloyl-ACP methyl ester carboxylesterase